MFSIRGEEIPYILLFFIIYSIAGWILESLFRSYCEKRWVNTGFLYGPFCPIYGCGTLIILIFLYGLKDNIFLLFLSGVLILTAWEYLVGLYLEKVFHKKYWDYSNEKFQINGRICLSNSFYWGLLSVLFVKIIHPFTSNIVLKIPSNIVIILNIISYSIFLIDFILSVKALHLMKDNIIKIKEIEKKILEKTKLLKSYKKIHGKVEDARMKLENEILEMELQLSSIKLRVWKELEKIKFSFPAINVKPINNFFDEYKVDVKEMKKQVKELNVKIKEKLKLEK